MLYASQDNDTAKTVLQHMLPSKTNTAKWLYAWAAINYNFNFNFTLYTSPTNSNGKILHNAYINQILVSVVESWIDCGDVFVLEEDKDTGHVVNKCLEYSRYIDNK